MGPLGEAQGAAPAPAPPGGGAAATCRHGAGPPEQGAAAQVAAGKPAWAGARPQPPPLPGALSPAREAPGPGGGGGGPCLRLGLLALAGARAQGHLLADAGPGAISLRQLAAQKGLGEHIPLKGGGEPRDERRLLGRRRPGPSLYRLWVVEGVFGAMKTRLWGGYLPEVLPKMAQKGAYLEAVAVVLAPAAAPLNAPATTLTPQPCTRPLQVLICKTSPQGLANRNGVLFH